MFSLTYLQVDRSNSALPYVFRLGPRTKGQELPREVLIEIAEGQVETHTVSSGLS